MKEISETFIPFSTIDMEDEELSCNYRRSFTELLAKNLATSTIGKTKTILVSSPEKEVADGNFNILVEIFDDKFEKKFDITITRSGMITYFIFSRGIEIGEWKRVKSDSVLSTEEFDDLFPTIIKSLT